MAEHEMMNSPSDVFSPSWQNEDPWAGGDYWFRSNSVKSAEAVRADLRGLYMQRDAQQFNSSEAAKARDWEKMMSDTAFQRQVADLTAAGFSPLAALGSASGASTPSAAVASSSANGSHSASADDGGILKAISSIIGLVVSKGMTSAMLAQQMQDKAQLAVDVANNRTEAAQKIADARIASQEKMHQDTIAAGLAKNNLNNETRQRIASDILLEQSRQADAKLALDKAKLENAASAAQFKTMPEYYIENDGFGNRVRESVRYRKKGKVK